MSKEKANTRMWIIFDGFMKNGRTACFVAWKLELSDDHYIHRNGYKYQSPIGLNNWICFYFVNTQKERRKKATERVYMSCMEGSEQTHTQKKNEKWLRN